MEVTCFRVTGPMGRAGIQIPANLVFFPLFPGAVKGKSLRVYLGNRD